MQKRGKSLVKIKSVIEQLATKGILESRYKKHPLVGNWQGFYECHIEPDWLLIYKIGDAFGFIFLKSFQSEKKLESGIYSVSEARRNPNFYSRQGVGGQR